MMIKFLATITLAILLLLGSASTFAASMPFSDVPNGHWAYDAVNQLASEGIVNGYKDNTFRGQRNITRYEFTTMLANLYNKHFPAISGENPFSDLPAGHQFYDAVVEMGNLGIVQGFENGTFRGQRNLTRYECAYALTNFLLKTGKITNLSTSSNFVDVSKDHSAYEAVATMENEKIIEGYGDDTFRGQRSITRYEMAAILSKFNTKYFAEKILNN